MENIWTLVFTLGFKKNKTVSHVPSDVCHGAQSVITLSDSDSGHLIHSQDCGLFLGQHLHQFRVLSRVDEADQSGCVLHQLHLMDAQCWVENGGANLTINK